MIRLKEIARDDVIPLCRLDVAPSQRDFVAPNAWSLAQLHYETGGYAFAVMLEDTHIGFVQVVDSREHKYLDPDDDAECCYLWRMMIAEAHQRKGHGRQVMEALFDWARARGNPRFETSCVESNSAGLAFYAALGMTPTGRMDGNEMILSRPL